MQSSAIMHMAAKAMSVRLVSCFPSRYIAGSINMPASAPAKRHPKGVMPKMATDQLMITLPRGGWEVS